MKQKLLYRQRQPVFIPSPCGSTEELTCIAIVTDYSHSSKLLHFYIIFNTNMPYFSNTVGTQCGDGGGGKSNLDPVLQSGSKCQLVTIFLGRALLTFIITAAVRWAEAEGRWRTVLSLGAGVRQRRRRRSRKLVRGDRRKEGALCSLRSLSPYCLPQF